MTDFKIPAEMAEEEFIRMCDAVGIDHDMTGETQETIDGFNDIKRKLVKAFMLGDLILSDSGMPIYTTMAGKRLEFKEMTGAVLMSMDRVKEGENTKKMFTALNELTGGGVAPAQLKMKDTRVLFALISAFLAL